MKTKSIASMTAALTLALGGAATADTLFITADRMVDVLSGKVIEQPAVIVDGERITMVGTRSQLQLPAGDRRCC